ncbi:MAG TPA: holo-ACP synthase [Polyangia bacterium]|nr:holo-ACP synthase [Polyangia bacterium]
MGTGVGIDLVMVSRVEASLSQFGERFLRRVFTDGEIAYATSSPAVAAERLAARFAAKEAAIKAIGLGDGHVQTGIGWRDIEVVREDSGRCRLILHGAARAAADEAGVAELSVSLTHEGDYSAAVVLAISSPSPSNPPQS